MATIQRSGVLLCLLGALSLFGFAAPARTQTPSVPVEISELARALKGDPDLIYEYVYNNIQTIPMYGSVKGPLGALLDGEGTSFDQAELMVLLLRQSGFTANYAIGQIQMPQSKLSAWLGTDDLYWSLFRVISAGFRNFGHAASTETPPVHYVYADLWWAWVQVNIGGTNYVFDPSVKDWARTTGISRTALLTAAGYSQSAFLSGAEGGATINSTNVVGLDRNSVRSNLSTYAANLTQYLKTNYPTASTRDIIGGVSIVPLPLGTHQRITSLPYQGSTPTIYTEISQFRTLLRQQLGWTDSNGNFTALTGPLTLNSSDVYGRRMTVTFSSSGIPNLLLDGVPQLVAGSAVPSGYQLTVRVSISYPWTPTQFAYPGVQYNDATRIEPVANSVNALMVSWGRTTRGTIERHRRILQENMAANPGDLLTESILGESLSIVGFTYAAEAVQRRSIVREQMGLVDFDFHVYGTFAMGTHGNVTGPFISIWILNYFSYQRANRPESPALTPLEVIAFSINSSWGSVGESATLEQTQPGATAVSTVKVLDTAVQQGILIWDINNKAVAGDDKTYYQQTVRADLQQHGWSASDLAALDRWICISQQTCIDPNILPDGYRIIAPQSGAVAIDQFVGAAWHAVDQVNGGMGGLISGNVRGGLPAVDIPPVDVPPATLESVLPSASFSDLLTTLFLNGDAGAIAGLTPVSFDPVNLVTGDYLNDTTDLSVGGAAPLGLALQRYYDSGTRLRDGPLGLGWTHNFVMTAATDSDPFEGLGANSPISGAGALIATAVALDILDTGNAGARPLSRIVISAMIHRWIADQLTSNIVAVKQPGYVEHFIKLADGSYNPPPGTASILSLDGGAYTYLTKDRTTLRFNADGNLATWANAAGASMSFAYGGTPKVLTSVANNLGRSLSLIYHPSGKLIQVVDDSGRAVTYAYDGAGNLASFTDVLGQTTTYAYDLPGRLTSIVYPWTAGAPFVTNTYDALGRVKTQTNVNGATWEYFLAGTRSEEIDPYGVRHVLYSTPRGKTRIEIQDFQGPLQAISTNVFDGLDRVILATAPEGNSTAYTYDPNSNVPTVTKNPKPGSPLSPLVTSTIYDLALNKPTRIIDPRGLVTVNEYAPWTGNLLSTTADATNLKARTSYTYNGVGQVLTVTDPVGTLTRNVYDGFGNLTSTIADAGPGRLNLTTSSTYNARGDPLTVTDARGNVTTSTYDLARRRLSTATPPTGDAPAGLLTRYTYDPAGKVLQTQQSANGAILRTTSATYTRAGKPETTTDANGNTTRFAYDPLDRLTTATDPMGRTTRYAYDALGRRISATNPTIQATPLAQQTFTLNGQRASLTDANSNTTAFAYDGLDRLSTTTYPGGSTEVLTYDASGNILTRKTRAGGTPIAYTYDTLNRLLTKTPPSPWPAVSYSYDRAGRQTGASDNSAAIASVAMPGSTVAYTTAYTYDALNRPRAVSWDPAPAATAPAAGPVVTFAHAYNKANQRTAETATDATWLGYPAASPNTTAYTANSLNQYTAVGAVTPTYDANGNLTFDGAYTLEHDAENRLVSATDGTNGAAYAFDGRGRRKLKAVGETSVTISVTDAGNREVLEYDGLTGTVLRWYPYGIGPNAVLNQINVGAGTRDTPIPNLLGSIAGSYDSTGSLTKFGYQPYGSGAAAPQFAYTGQRIDPEAGGLYYYRARHYSTAFGRFLQPDPIGYSGGSHLYGYAANDPLNLVDPEGLAWEGISNAFYSLTQSDFGATAGGLLQTMADPYVGFYQRAVVQPFYAAAGAIAQSPVGDPGLYASLQGMGPPGAVVAGVGSTAAYTFGAIARFGGALGPGSQLAVNSAAGASFERAVGAQLQQSGLVVGQQVSVQTMSGTRTRLDFVTRDPVSGLVGCVECKASPTASLTRNQRLAFPEIGQSGGTVIGAGKPGFPGGLRIPPTDVDIIRGP